MEKRLFFGMEVKAPWPSHYPPGRQIEENSRHLTLAFLGNVSFQKVEGALAGFPSPFFKVGFGAKFDQCLFFPPRHPRVVAWHVDWLDGSCEVNEYAERLTGWLEAQGFQPDRRHPFNPHVTLARSPFHREEWARAFLPLPLVAQSIHLYESLGHLTYQPLWTYPLLPPFEEREHTADRAFLVRGESYKSLFHHAALALSFHFPPLLPFISYAHSFDNLEDVIIKLNECVGLADQEIGCPFKAVSFHSHLQTFNHIFEWEMITDV